MTENRHITAQVSSAQTGEITSDMVIDTHTGAYVGTEEVGDDVSELMGLFGSMAARMDPVTGDFDTEGMTADELAMVERVNALAEDLDNATGQ